MEVKSKISTSKKCIASFWDEMLEKQLKLIVFAFEVNFKVRMLNKQPQTAIKATPPAETWLHC